MWSTSGHHGHHCSFASQKEPNDAGCRRLVPHELNATEELRESWHKRFFCTALEKIFETPQNQPMKCRADESEPDRHGTMWSSRGAKPERYANCKSSSTLSKRSPEPICVAFLIICRQCHTQIRCNCVRLRARPTNITKHLQSTDLSLYMSLPNSACYCHTVFSLFLRLDGPWFLDGIRSTTISRGTVVRLPDVALVGVPIDQMRLGYLRQQEKSLFA